ncbi:MAG: hypothetical protein JKY65_22310 [Planctomycetes bacterium]|nr:hypothetical protein [Planctomycetota bacterium]
MLPGIRWRRQRVSLRRVGRNMTLVELLVAVALSVILIGVMTFVWIQSNKIFSTQLNRIETYQRVRVIMDTLERDLANTQLTSDMEFYTDTDQDGFYKDPSNGGVDLAMPASKGGGNFRDPNDETDPLLGQSEFGLDGGDDLNQPLFTRAPTIISPDPYEITTDGYLDIRSYWRDEVYVRSFITIGDKNRPALIHYRLVQTSPGGRSMLRRRIWFVDSTTGTVTDATDQFSILAADICDLKVGFLFKPNPLSGDLNRYHVAPTSGGYTQTQHNDLLDYDHNRGFVSTFDGRATPTAVEPLSAQHTGALKFQTSVGFQFEGNARIEERDLGPVALRGLSGDVSTALDTLNFGPAPTGFPDYDNFDFRGVRPGTRILVYDATDDDTNVVTTNRTAGNRFAPRLLTIETVPAEGATVNNSVDSYVSLQFLEPINFSRLRASWLGAEETVIITATDYKHAANPGSSNLCGPARTVSASFNVHYRVGFLPAAFIIRMSVDDRNNQKVIPMERVIRLLQQ